MRHKIYSIFSLLMLTQWGAFAQSGLIKGRMLDQNKKALSGVTVTVIPGGLKTQSDLDGLFSIAVSESGSYEIRFSAVGLKPFSIQQEVDSISDLRDIAVTLSGYDLDEVEVFGERNKQPKGLESITRMPLKPSDQIQSISVISAKVIEDQGVLTLTDAVRNIPGVTLFGSYGGVKESMSTRGFRGVPVLKNGVRMDSQIQTASAVVDMQGVESIQMIKGSAAVTQGVSTDLGNGGGVINVVTKTPNFVESGQVGIRTGSWGQFRPTFDVQTLLDQGQTVAFRLNGAYERADSYRRLLHSNRVYLNPSFAWKPSDKTTITVESDYLNDKRMPHNSAVNRNPSQSVNALYVLPHEQLLGMKSDRNNTVIGSLMARVDQELNAHFRIRTAYARSNYEVDNTATAATLITSIPTFDRYARAMSRNLRQDKNTTFQFDVIGQDLYTGRIKHTAQAGFDYRVADVKTTNYKGTLSALESGIVLANTTVIDTVDILHTFSNDLSEVLYRDKSGVEQRGKKIGFAAADPIANYYRTFGVLAQDVLEFNPYLKAALGLRYSEIMTEDFVSNRATSKSAWNPSVGIIVSPKADFNIFASYTNSTSLRSSANLMANGETIGASTTKQWEGGLKSDWLQHRLRFNLTYFHIKTSNLSNSEYVAGTNQATGYYFKAGDLVRNGVEAELNGRVLDNLSLMLGYAYLDAQYRNSPSYVNGSAPMNAPKHTANGWIQYRFKQGVLQNLSWSTGIYYVGKRPVNEYSLTPDGHGNIGGQEPFDMPAYSTLNAQIAYVWKHIDARIYLNNLSNEIGLNSYLRGGYINQIDPRNVAVALRIKL